MTGDPTRREPTRLDAVVADEKLIEEVRTGRCRPGDALVELLGAWLDDIHADRPEEA